MFGIPDPGIWMAYLLAILCFLFSVWFGIKYWNKDDEKDK
jgi:TRAP-type C4-dicarboxylate transport system permease small subunit